jgi:hypothetical protein
MKVFRKKGNLTFMEKKENNVYSVKLRLILNPYSTRRVFGEINKRYSNPDQIFDSETFLSYRDRLTFKWNSKLKKRICNCKDCIVRFKNF